MKGFGVLHKMSVRMADEIQYSLRLDDEILCNTWIGKELKLSWTGVIICSSCGKQTKRTFNDGFCFACFSSAPEAAECIIRPELCRAHLGEGRDVEWEQQHHNVPHVVYLASTDVVKVGVTRKTQIPSRWIDQGAAEAIILAETPNRYEAGRMEVALKDFYTDKTNWRSMLSGKIDIGIDLIAEKWELSDQLPMDFQAYISEEDSIYKFNYPVESYPIKVQSIGFEKEPVVCGNLIGIRGQYLLFSDNRVLNIRKHTGFQIEYEVNG